MPYTNPTYSVLKAGPEWIIISDEKVIGRACEARITITKGGWPTEEEAQSVADGLNQYPPVRITIRGSQVVYTPRPGSQPDLLLRVFKAADDRSRSLGQLMEETGFSEGQVRHGIDNLRDYGIKIDSLGQGSKTWRLAAVTNE